FGEVMITSECTVPNLPTAPDTPCLRAERQRNFLAYGGYDQADGVSYGYIHDALFTTTFSSSGVTVPQLGVHILPALTGSVAPAYEIPAGDSRSFTRYFAVGETVSSITDIRDEIQCAATGSLEGTVTAGGSPAVHADITILGSLAAAQTGLAYNAVTHTRTD